ncbi:MAG: InlB B-repeat-containing protein, partial [Spirochaetaceae bacterium]|nr:InlB B-repeat-containing protein [Spirochaetaceae bacterium]
GNIFTQTGYTFAGWNTAANGSGTSYAAGASVTNLAAAGTTVTLYAQWQIYWDGTGRFVGISYDGTKVAWSSDEGLSWNEADTGLTFGVTSMAYGNGVFVAGGEGYTAWSDNGGGTWNSVELLPASSANWENMAYGNGVFVTVDRGVPEVHNTSGKSRTAAYSIDNGKTWTLTTLPSEDYWGPVIYGEGVFVTIAAGSNFTTYSSTNAAYSKDYGKTWQLATLPKNEYWTAAAYGNGGFIAIPDNNTRVAWSDNGETWSSEGLAMLPFPRLFYSVTCGNGVFVSVRFTTSDEYCKAIYSDDNGQTWNVVDVGRPRKGSNYVGDVVFGNGTFLVTTNDGLSLYSKNNGQTWAQGGEFSFNIMQSMAYGAR